MNTLNCDKTGSENRLLQNGLGAGICAFIYQRETADNRWEETPSGKIILATFDGLFENGAVIHNGYTFSLDPNNVVYNGRGIYEVQFKLINITFNKA